MRITKKSIDYHTCENMNDEVIYIFCRDKKKIERLSEYHLCKNFRLQKYIINVNGICTNKRENANSIKLDYLMSKQLIEDK